MMAHPFGKGCSQGAPLNMDRPIYVYEVELKLTNKNTREVKLVTRTEHAYTVFDAVMQASMNQAAEIGTGSADIELARIGPPAAAIREATQKLADDIAALVGRLGRKPYRQATDAVRCGGR